MIKVYAKGVASKNSGQGAWSAIVAKKGHDPCAIRGHISIATNQQIEIIAVTKALKFLADSYLPEIDLDTDRGGSVTIYTENRNISDAFNQGKIPKWKNTGFRKKGNRYIVNRDLWMDLVEQVDKFESVTLVHVGNREDSHIATKVYELVDELRKNFALQPV